jgi:GPI mannosyltransferase 3
MLLFAALACSIRVTNSIIWLCMVGMLFWDMRLHPKLLKGIFLDMMAIG